MLEYCCSMALEQLCHLVDGQPNRFVLKLHFKFRLSVLRLEGLGGAF